MTAEKHVIRDSWDIASWTPLQESADKPKNPGVLAILEGPMFAVDGMSLNNRFYPRECWDNAISESAPTIEKNLGLYGMVGHEREIDDSAISDGAIAIRTTKLWIDEDKKVGMGRIEVLNTEHGRKVNELLRCGFKIPVSSRAIGTVLKGEGPDGTDLVEAKNFHLERFDMVAVPGIAYAIPELKEHKTQLNGVEPMNENQKLNEATQTVAVIERLAEEKAQSTIKLTEALAQNAAIAKQLAEAKEANVKAAGIVGDTNTQNKIKESMGRVLKTLAPEKLAEALISGNIAQPLVEALTLLESYMTLGTVKEIEEAKKLNGEYATLGDVKSIKEGLDLLKQFAELKTKPADLAKQLKEGAVLKQGYAKAKAKVNAKKIADHFKIPESLVFSMLENGMKNKEVIAHFKSLSEKKELKNLLTLDAKPKQKTPITETRKSNMASMMQEMSKVR